MQILRHFPHTVHNAYKPQYDRIIWRNNKDEFEQWKLGNTGYPMVEHRMTWQHCLETYKTAFN